LLTVTVSSETMTETTFKNRVDAGQQLSRALLAAGVGKDAIILALPRGGVPVAECVARACGADLDVVVVRKIGVPGHHELAAGAIASGGVVVWNERVLASLGLSPRELRQELDKEQRTLSSRERELRPVGAVPLDLSNRAVVLVDDGVATGATMRAAIHAVRLQKPRSVLVALPVAPEDTCQQLEALEGCDVICLKRIATNVFDSVGAWYDDFNQVETRRCRAILEKYKGKGSGINGNEPAHASLP
jgi:putative phosphoribosyl transferase